MCTLSLSLCVYVILADESERFRCWSIVWMCFFHLFSHAATAQYTEYDMFAYSCVNEQDQ